MSHAHAIPPHSPAPWAELVPNMPRMTVEEYNRLPDDGWQYELVDGRLVRMPRSGGEASTIAAGLAVALGAFVYAHKLGRVTGADGGYDFSTLGQPDTELGPDVAFVRPDRVPPCTSPDYARVWPLAPDIVAEVASPHQYRPEMAAKVQRYLAAGVRLVWAIWPRYQQVDVWRPDDTRPSAVLTTVDALDGLDVPLGFSFPVADLFA